MASFNYPSTFQIALYPTLADFPTSASNGAFGLALDTDILYVFSTGSNTWIPIAGPGFITSIGTIDSVTPSANGAVVSASQLIMQSASGSVPGLVNLSAQTFAGVKTFSSPPNLSSLTASTALVLDVSKNIASLAYGSANVISTLVERDGSGNFSAGTITASLTGHASLDVATSSLGTVTEATSSVLTLTGWTNATVGSPTIQVKLASTSVSGYLSSTDWNTFNSKGSVSSVALSVPATSIFGVTGSPVTGSGTLGLTTTGTSGGIPYFSSTSALSSSALLTASQLIIGGGAGAAPSSLAAGSQYQVLTMGASNPGYGAVNLAQAAAVTGVLPNANTTAVSTNTVSTIVLRDGSGNFAAGTITAALTGTASGNTTYSANNHGVVISGSANTMTVIAPDASTTKVLTSGGTGADPSWANISTSSFGTQSAGTYLGGPYSGSAANPTFKAFQAPTIQKFTSGSGTYTTATGALYIRVRMVGGGGGGAGSSTVVANNGGTGGTGGNSTFGTTLLVANGGVGGSSYFSGSGGTASLGSGPIGTALTGGQGQASFGSTTNNGANGGMGGVSPFGGAGGNTSGGTGSAAVTNSGSGGGGGQGGASSLGGGGGGASGFVDAIITSPSATYSYAIGAAGTAGTAGTGGSAGGAGGSGYIEVIEYYQ